MISASDLRERGFAEEEGEILDRAPDASGILIFQVTCYYSFIFLREFATVRRGAEVRDGALFKEDATMALFPLKCPKCGSGIYLDDQEETGVCEYCGHRFSFQEAARNYVVELAGKLTPEGPVAEGPVVFTTTTTTTTTTRNGKTTTVNGQSADLREMMSQLMGATSGAGAETILDDVAEGKSGRVLFENTVTSVSDSTSIPGYEIDPNTLHAIRAYLAENQKVAAIKLFRSATHTSLKESKDVIESLDAGQPRRDVSAGDLSSKGRTDDPSLKVSKCYIATAVYGSYDAPEVRVLRRFRDEVLSTSVPGRAFVRGYYAVSPPVARRLEHAGRINRLVRRVLDLVVHKLEGASRRQ